MLLPRVVAAALALRQAADILPIDYCQPECPACKTNIIGFNAATSCVDSSQFLTNCGACQQCIITYSIQNGSLALLPDLQNTLSTQINRCAGTGGSAQVSQIASQASRLSDLNVQLATLMPSAATNSAQGSASPTASVQRSDPNLSSILATATWSSRFAAGMASVTAASLSSAASAASSASVASRLSDITSGVTPAPAASSTTAQSAAANSKAGPGPKLSQTWVAGPVIGSILGMSTVFVVIYCTRVKHRREEWELGPVKPHEKEDDEESAQQEDPGKPQLHSECVLPKEMANTEVIPPVELPVPEPVGMELLTPRSLAENPKEWPLPISPLPALFASAEIRDQRNGAEESPKHETFYHA